MTSSAMFRCEALVRTDVSEELFASITNRRARNTVSSNCIVFDRSVRRLLIIANVVPIVSISPILVSLMMKALNFSEKSVLTRATQHNIPEDGILHSHRRENLKSYIALTGWAL
jgi:hypothetical protein